MWCYARVVLSAQILALELVLQLQRRGVVLGYVE